MKLVNLTPHEVTLVAGERKLVLPAAAAPARCETSRLVIGWLEVDGATFPVNETRFGHIVNLPEPTPGTTFLVSRIVAQARWDRTDLLVVDDTIRDEKGRIVGARALARV